MLISNSVTDFRCKSISVFAAATLALALFFPAVAGAENATIPGAISTPYPTLTCLAVEWLIRGDDNQNGKVEVSYRAVGESEWKQAMPLVRVPAGNTGSHTRPTFYWMNKHSGSIFDLRPDTGYEIRLSLSDPDGGRAVETVTARTRPVPRAAADARVIEVNPRTLRRAAMRADPGDILLLSPGYYGSFEMPVDGEPGRPIVIRADNAHPVIGSTFDEVSLERRKHVILDGVRVYGPVRLRWAEDVAVRYCDIHSKHGIIATETPGAKNCYIADNTVSYVMPWVPEGMGSNMPHGGAANVGEGIELTGPGNVICYNRVSGYRDCISTMEDIWVYDQICIDIYNNDISVGVDDGIEADFCMNNCRIMRNRITNCAMGLSSQPGLGGPTYFIRNVMYNLTGAPFKLERLSYGNIFLHNTVVKAGDGFYAPHWQGEYFRTVFRNNLTVGGPIWQKPRSRRRSKRTESQVVRLPGFNSSCEFDYNGVGIHDASFKGMVGPKSYFTDIEGLRKLTGGGHSIRVDLDVFAADVKLPYPPVPEWKVADLRLRAGSAAVDAALPLPNVNDGFSGAAPDLGAYELGAEMPHYGPRPRGEDNR